MSVSVIRLDYHDGALERPLLGVVRPLLDGMPALSASLRVHWSSGHHLTVRLPESVQQDHVARITADLAQWVSVNPSTGGADDLAFAAFAAAQARAEGLTDRIEPRGADNAVRVGREDETDYLGSAAIAGVRVAFEQETARPLLALLAAGQNVATTRLQIMLVEVACAYRDGGAANGVRSLRAHGRNFLAAHPALEARFEATYRHVAPMLVDRVARVLADRHSNDAFSTALTAAGDRLDALADAGTDIALAGVHRLAEADASGAYAMSHGMARWLSPQVINGAPDKRRAFGRHRVLVNLVYGQCPVLGINPIARFACAYLAFRALADALGLPETALQPSQKAA